MDSRIDWNYWRRMWRIDLTRYWWRLLTPWFAIELRSGLEEKDDWPWNYWKGIRVW
jgi:hypothetical protein